MHLEDEVRSVFSRVASTYPYPLAVSCKRFLDQPPEDQWQEWEKLSRDILQSVLHYLSHLLLSDLVATGQRPAQLYHRIQAILKRPIAGHYVGFLRETARYFRDEKLQSSVPELIEFLLASDVDCVLTTEGKGLLGLLVDYRNLWAHGRISNTAVMGEVVRKLRQLTLSLLQANEFLTRYPLRLEDGTRLMGWELKGVSKEPQPLVVVIAGEVNLRPLLLKLKGVDLVLLEEADLQKKKLSYRGSATYHQFKKKDVEKGDGRRIFEELKELLEKVQAIDAVLELKDIGWNNFKERADVLTDRTISLYSEMQKYVPDLYVARPEWEGEESIFTRFLNSDKTLLAINGVEGTGKSALVSRLAKHCQEEGHAVLFVNAQRFTFARVKFRSVNPYPEYFSHALHYGAPFDRETISRVIKTADEGKKVILFIDAINEVDGLEEKWNRFKAMDLLLEWISSIAQPGLKVVLSFRLEVYEEFEYLQEDEWPKNLLEISYPGRNPRKPWVTDLEPFSEQQARRLYEELQGREEYGMSPAMSWEEMKKGLGEALPEIIENPLIFIVFLRAHNGENKVVSTNRDNIFVQYAGKLTGSIEEAKKPWWKRAGGFIQNGNITKKERLLADLIEKMSEEGGAAFMVERLNPKKKRDKRMMALLEYPQDETFKDLKEGGLLVEERIEVQEGSCQLFSQRITFVGELVIAAMSTIWTKMRRRDNLRGKILFLLTMSILVFLFTLVACEIFVLPFKSQMGLFTFNDFMKEHLISVVRIHFYKNEAKAALVFCSLLSMAMVLKSPRMRIGKDISILAQAAARKVKNDAVLAKIALWSGIPALLWSLLWIGKYSFWVTTSPLIGVAVALVLLLYAPPIRALLFRLGAKNIPPRLLRSAASSEILFLQSKRYKRELISTLAKPFLLSLPIALLAYFLLRAETLKSDFSTMETYGEQYIGSLFIFYSSVAEKAIAGPRSLFIITSILAPLLVACLSFAVTSFNLSEAKYFFENPLPEKPKFGTVRLLAFFYLTMSVVTSGAFICERLRTQQAGDLRLLERSDWSGTTYRANKEGQITYLNASKAPINAQEIDEIYRFPLIDTLILPIVKGMSIDVARFPHLLHLSGRADCIQNYNDLLPRTALELQDLDEISTSDGTRAATVNLSLKGKSRYLSKLTRIFPFLVQLAIGEDLAREVNFGEFEYGPHLALRIISDGSPKLDWLTPSTARYIIVLEKALDVSSENINLLQRLWVKADSLEPATLKKASNLRWLLLRLAKTQSAQWYKELREVVESSLPKLATLELMKPDDPKSLRSATGKKEIISLLQGLEENPALAGGEP